MLVGTEFLISKELSEESLTKVPPSGWPGPCRSFCPVGGHDGKGSQSCWPSKEVCDTEKEFYTTFKWMYLLSSETQPASSVTPPSWLSIVLTRPKYGWLTPRICWVPMRDAKLQRHLKTYSFHFRSLKPSRKSNTLLFLTCKHPSPVTTIW